MTQEHQLDFESFIDVMVQIYKLTSDKIDYSTFLLNELLFLAAGVVVAVLFFCAMADSRKNPGYGQESSRR